VEAVDPEGHLPTEPRRRRGGTRDSDHPVQLTILLLALTAVFLLAGIVVHVGLLIPAGAFLTVAALAWVTSSR
jgi:hypothetical protein